MGSGKAEVGCIADISDFETGVGICSFARRYFVFVELLTPRQRVLKPGRNLAIQLKVFRFCRTLDTPPNSGDVD